MSKPALYAVRWAIVAIVLAPPVGGASAQTRGQSVPLRLYLDCNSCDSDYVRTEIDWVDYVRDRQDADVHVLVTTQTAGVGGQEYTMNFIGRGRWEGRLDTLRYVATSEDTNDTRRQGIVRVLKMGLMRYVADTPLASRVQIGIRQAVGEESVTTPAADPWNQWVFTIGANGYLQGESLQSFANVFLSLGANRTTDEWKIRISGTDSYGESSFEIDDTTTVTSIRRQYSGSLLIANSVGPQWSVGLGAGAESSTFGNIELSYRIAPSIEYDFFPYSESTRRILTATYSIGVNRFDYKDVTIFGEVAETRGAHSLSLDYETRQPWGQTGVELSASQFLHDATKYRWSASINGSVRLFRGLSVNGFAAYSRIRDQLAVQAGTATEQEILLRQRLLRTNYSFFGSFGLQYRFGSIFNSVVNPRMRNGVGSGSTIIIG